MADIYLVVETATNKVKRIAWLAGSAADITLGDGEEVRTTTDAAIKAAVGTLFFGETTFTATEGFQNPTADNTQEVISHLNNYHRQCDRWRLDSAVYPQAVQTNVALWMDMAHIVADMIYTASNIPNADKPHIYDELGRGADGTESVEDFYRGASFGAPSALVVWYNFTIGKRTTLPKALNLGDLPNPLTYNRLSTIWRTDAGVIVPPGGGDALTWTVPA